MNATVTAVRPGRKLTLRCRHPQESAAHAGSTLECRICGQRCKVTKAMVAAAESKLATKRASPRHAPRPAAEPEPV